MQMELKKAYSETSRGSIKITKPKQQLTVNYSSQKNENRFNNQESCKFVKGVQKDPQTALPFSPKSEINLSYQPPNPQN